jgi:hypothetical protein
MKSFEFMEEDEEDYEDSDDIALEGELAVGRLKRNICSTNNC